MMTLPKVFLCYAHRDKQELSAVVRALDDIGLEARYDRRQLEPDVEWDAAILDAIEEVDVVVWLVSDAALRSHHVQREIRHARARGKLMIAVMLPGRTSELPTWMKKRQYVALADDGTTDTTALMDAIVPERKVIADFLDPVGSGTHWTLFNMDVYRRPVHDEGLPNMRPLERALALIGGECQRESHLQVTHELALDALDRNDENIVLVSGPAVNGFTAGFLKHCTRPGLGNEWFIPRDDLADLRLDETYYRLRGTVALPPPTRNLCEHDSPEQLGTDYALLAWVPHLHLGTGIRLGGCVIAAGCHRAGTNAAIEALADRDFILGFSAQSGALGTSASDAGRGFWAILEVRCLRDRPQTKRICDAGTLDVDGVIDRRDIRAYEDR